MARPEDYTASPRSAGQLHFVPLFSLGYPSVVERLILICRAYKSRLRTNKKGLPKNGRPFSFVWRARSDSNARPPGS
jgi:hypothetical protein